MADILENPVLAGASGAIVNQIGSLLGMSGSAHYQRKNMRYAAQLQHDENVYWAEYNTPANQMARLKAAGLNPNLVYGNGADAQFKGEVSPSGAAPDYNGHAGTDFLNFARMAKEMQQIEANTKLLDEQARKAANEADSVEYDNRRKAAATPEYMGFVDRKQAWENYLATKQGIAKEQAQELLFDSQRALNQLTYNIDSETQFQIKHELLNGYMLNNAITSLDFQYYIPKLEAELNLKNWQAKQCFATISNLYALSRLYDMETNVKAQEGVGVMIKNGLDALQYDLAKWNVPLSTTDWAAFWEKWIGPVTNNLGKLFGGSANYTFGQKK